jgi:hypothetical protein
MPPAAQLPPNEVEIAPSAAVKTARAEAPLSTRPTGGHKQSWTHEHGSGVDAHFRPIAAHRREVVDGGTRARLRFGRCAREHLDERAHAAPASSASRQHGMRVDDGAWLSHNARATAAARPRIGSACGARTTWRSLRGSRRCAQGRPVPPRRAPVAYRSLCAGRRRVDARAAGWRRHSRAPCAWRVSETRGLRVRSPPSSARRHSATRARPRAGARQRLTNEQRERAARRRRAPAWRGSLTRATRRAARWPWTWRAQAGCRSNRLRVTRRPLQRAAW